MLSFGDEEYRLDERAETLPAPTPLENINRWLSLNGGQLTDLTVASGGVGMSANLFGGGFTDLDVDTFIRVVATQPWREKGGVQLFIKSERDRRWICADLSCDFQPADE